MTGFIAFAVVVLIGVGFVFKLMMSEGKEEAVALNLDDIKTDEPALKPPPVEKEKKISKSEHPSRKSIVGSLFQKLKAIKKNRDDVQAMDTAAFSIKEALEKSKESGPIEDPAVSMPNVGTMAIKTSPFKLEPKALTKEEEIKIEKEIEVSTQLDELKDKHERLDKLFKEKSDEFIKVQAALDIELRNRKEFNKVKDILEKEISETKDKLRKAQVETSAAKTEADSYKKRINILEEKTTRLEKDILSKEHEIDNLVKRLQTFASPATAHKPPVKEVITPKPEPAPEPIQVREPEAPILEPIRLKEPEPVVSKPIDPEVKTVSEPDPVKPIESVVPEVKEEFPAPAPESASKEEPTAPASEPEVGLSLKPDVAAITPVEAPTPIKEIEIKEEVIPETLPQPKPQDKPINPDSNNPPAPNGP